MLDDSWLMAQGSWLMAMAWPWPGGAGPWGPRDPGPMGEPLGPGPAPPGHGLAMSLEP